MLNDGFMRVSVDRWGVLEKMGKDLNYFDINFKNNLSQVQYELVTGKGGRVRNKPQKRK